MIKPIKHINLNEPIARIQVLNDDSIVVVDSNTTIRYLKKSTLDLLTGFKAKIVHQRYKSKVIEFSPDGIFFASLSSNCRESRLYNAKTKKLIARVNRHHGEASCVGIDPNGKNMFSCGDDGKIFALDIKSGKLAFTLPAHIDTVNDIAFSRNGQWVATASYDRKISIFNLLTMTPKHKIKVHSYPVMKLQFLSRHRLCSIDKNNSGIILNIHTAKIIKRLEGIHDEVVQMATTDDGKFLFLATKLGYILVYELEHYELLSRSYIKLNTSITALAFDNVYQSLIIGTSKGDIYIYDIYNGVKELKGLLARRDYVNIEKSFEDNPILKYTKIYEVFESVWVKTLRNAKVHLERGDREKAIEAFKDFKNIPFKSAIIQKVLKDYEEYDKFVLYAKEGRLPLAYSMINTHPIYKETHLFKQIEIQWRKKFTLARKYALDPRGADKAREILKPYRGISEKTKFIQELLSQGEVYKRFKIAMGKKDFKIVFELIKQHPFLMEFPEYETLIKYADTLYIKSLNFIKEGENHNALKLLRILSDFDGFEREASSLRHDIEQKEKFYDAVYKENLETIYNILDNDEDLQSTKEGEKYEKEWIHDFTKANAFAVNGDVSNIKLTLQRYMNINSKYRAIATIFSWCYIMQLENAIREKREKKDIEDGIKNYILSFGLQEQIISFFEIFKRHFPQTKLNLDMQTNGSLDMWRPSMIVDSILD